MYLYINMSIYAQLIQSSGTAKIINNGGSGTGGVIVTDTTSGGKNGTIFSIDKNANVGCSGTLDCSGVLTCHSSDGLYTYAKNASLGYAILPGQIMMQWGQTTFSTSNLGKYPYQTVNFDASFSSTPYVVIGVGYTTAGASNLTNKGDVTIVGADNYSAGSFRLRLDTNDNVNFTTGVTAYWYAIGPS